MVLHIKTGQGTEWQFTQAVSKTVTVHVMLGQWIILRQQHEGSLLFINLAQSY